MQSKGGGNCHNCSTRHPPKCCPAYGKVCYNCNKKGHFKPLCRSHQCSQSGSRWKGSQSRSRKDQHEISSCDQTNDSSWSACEQDSIQIVYNKGICGNISNICFNEIDGQNCSRVLADLTLCKAQDPKDCHMKTFKDYNTNSSWIVVLAEICYHLDCTKNSFHMSPDKGCLDLLITGYSCYHTTRKKYISMVFINYMSKVKIVSRYASFMLLTVNLTPS